MFEKGQHIKILLTNNNLIEGIVEEYNDKLIKLKSLDDESFLFIHHPTRDIVMTKLVLKDIVRHVSPEKIEDEIQEVIQSPSSDLRIKKLAELRVELAEQEKRIVSEKLRDHQISSPFPVNYKSPFIKSSK